MAESVLVAKLFDLMWDPNRQCSIPTNPSNNAIS
jgi:hypothetical protein